MDSENLLMKKHNQIRSIILILLTCVWNTLCTAQVEQVVDHVYQFTVDKIGQLYYTDEAGNIYKHQAQNDSVKYYNNTLLGTPDMISAESGINVYIYYRDFGRLQILDNYVSLKEDLNLFDMGYSTISMMTASSDGGVWMYDIANSELLKLSKDLKLTYRSGDLRNVLGTFIEPVFLNESRGNIILASEDNVMIFDRFASYISSFASQHFRTATNIGAGYVVLTSDTLQYYDARNLMEPHYIQYDIPTAGIQQIDFADGSLYVQNQDTLIRTPVDSLRIY